jgi:peptide/nickel transport system substrate-binding protein
VVHRRRRQEREIEGARCQARAPLIAVRKRRSDPQRIRCGVLLFAFLATACSYGDSRSETPSSEQVVIGIPESTVQEEDAGLGYLSNQLTLEALTQMGADGRALPRLARSWIWESGERRLRLKLRDDVVLHDGRRFDSEVAAAALTAGIARPENLAAYPALRLVQSARSDGPFDLIVELSGQSSLLPEDLTILLDIPAGPYRQRARSNADLQFERFERYYLGRPSIRRVTLRSFDTLRTSWASLLRGELDVVYDVPSDALEFVESDDVQVARVKRWYQYAIAFNSRTGPLRSPVIRRALNMAIDRDTLIRDVLHGAGAPASGPLWPDYWAADNSIAPYTFDSHQASALLDAAGFPLRPSPDGGPAARFMITCLIPENFSEVERIALHVQKDLFNIGVDLRFKVVPPREFGQLMATGRFEASLLDMISGPTPGRSYVLWASAKRFRGAYNIFGYENDEAERLYETLRTTRNEAAVRTATRRLQRVLLDDPPALFLAWNERARGIRREFAFPKELGVDPVFSLWRWTRQPDTLNASVP